MTCRIRIGRLTCTSAPTRHINIYGLTSRLARFERTTVENPSSCSPFATCLSLPLVVSVRGRRTQAASSGWRGHARRREARGERREAGGGRATTEAMIINLSASLSLSYRTSPASRVARVVTAESDIATAAPRCVGGRSIDQTKESSNERTNARACARVWRWDAKCARCTRVGLGCDQTGSIDWIDLID